MAEGGAKKKKLADKPAVKEPCMIDFARFMEIKTAAGVTLDCRAGGSVK
jgi:hypothetical protein